MPPSNRLKPTRNTIIIAVEPSEGGQCRAFMRHDEEDS